ncbi:hypothetical protein [Actibacterium lipolyticum]|uniref:Uncharacterized protein n=1 Tax=Actibacterium lipolyticum TaxID=1524263 RepID=A0A238KSK6_9RHOB|nr:hypothetical protein [Actibacterium lipolyticum]SMX45805.1 hypothetical protein COL8621_02895 [Actibacterium lipolyticum]
MDLRGPDIRFWRKHLIRDERLLWDGRPEFEFKLDWTAVTMCLPAILFTVVFLADAQLFEGGFGASLSQDDPGTYRLLKIGSIGATLWCAVYIARTSMLIPQLTRYALTNKRALTRTLLPWPKVTVKRLTPMTEVEWNGTAPGSIFFDTENVRYGHKPTYPGLVGKFVIKERKNGFRNIADADIVYPQLLRAMEGKL